jgi:glutamate synthase domain-containing protein 3
MQESSMEKKLEIDAKTKDGWMDYRILNKRIRQAVGEGYSHIVVRNVNGQRFIGAGIKKDVKIDLWGDAGLDLGVFAEGPLITVHGSGEYLLGNTLNDGEIVVYGDSWDITGMGARGGSIFIMGNGGSRVGIHMKEFKDRKPVIAYGGKVKQYCGEYMAGGVIAVFGMDFTKAIKDSSRPVDKDNIDSSKVRFLEGDLVQTDLGAGIHGGKIYVRGKVRDELLGIYASKKDLTAEDRKELEMVIKRFCSHFNLPEAMLMGQEFTKIAPISSRPFGKAYAYTPV